MALNRRIVQIKVRCNSFADERFHDMIIRWPELAGLQSWAVRDEIFKGCMSKAEAQSRFRKYEKLGGEARRTGESEVDRGAGSVEVSGLR